VHEANRLSGKEDKAEGKVNDVIAVPEKAESPIVVIEEFDSKVTEFNEVHPSNAPEPILVML
tara:strand:+ start:409 stop:594 length:186 start_codon:yes stop_codon:yes gene_type:complete